MIDIYPELLVKLCVNDTVFIKGNKIALILVVVNGLKKPHEETRTMIKKEVFISKTVNCI